MASKAEIARDTVRVIITEDTAKGPKARMSYPANMPNVAEIAQARVDAYRAEGRTVTVATVTMKIV